ncbi:MAG: accessory factor UbiK family protein [Oceanicaulis sp.]
MQSRSPFFNDLADLMTDAFSAAQAAGEEAKTAMRARAERFAEELDLVTREEFEAVRARAEAAEAELDALKARIDALEAAGTGARTAARKAPAKRGAAKKSSG